MRSGRAIRISLMFATWHDAILANAHLMAGEYTEAAELAESVVAADDSGLEALLTVAAARAALGQERQAAAVIEQAGRASPDLEYRDPASRPSLSRRGS